MAKPLWATVFGLVVVAASLTISVRFDLIQSGFNQRTIWDVLDVLGVPLVVAFIAGMFAWGAQIRAGQRFEADQELNNDRSRETALRTFLDRMTVLVIDRNLQDSERDSPEQAVAIAHTFATLRGLDGARKGLVVKFLYESNLINNGKPVVGLARADLRSSDLGGLYLSRCDMSGANLSQADLWHTDLSESSLVDAILVGADLYYTDLRDADLSGADLHLAVIHDADLAGVNLAGAKVTESQLAGALSLVGATMPDGAVMTQERWVRFRNGYDENSSEIDMLTALPYNTIPTKFLTE